MRFALSLLLLASPAAFAEKAGHYVKASLVSEIPSPLAGQAFTLALKLEHEPHWHTYWQDPGDAGLPTTVKWELPKGASAGPLLWPRPKKFSDGSGLVGYGYTGTAYLLTEIRGAKPGDVIKAKVDWLMCKDVCIPDSALLSWGGEMDAVGIGGARKTLGKNPEGYGKGASSDLTSPPRTKTAAAAAPPPLSAAERGGGDASGLPNGKGGRGEVVWMLLLAFLGGLILNLMPCVLPVLSLKVLDFVQQSGDSRAHALRFSGVFTLGMLISFWAMATLVSALKAGGQAVGWGFQFQSPVFVAFMAALVLAVALNLFGVFEVLLPGSVADPAHAATKREGYGGAFFQGVFMTLLSTPCTAPFLGTALGFAFSQSTAVLFLIFTAVGLGLAAPFVAISAFPALKAWLPRPGAWMIRFKQFMAFPMLATLVWLLWVLDRQVGPDAVLWCSGWLVLVSFAFWLYGHRHAAWAGALVVAAWALGGWWLAAGPLKAAQERPAHQLAMAEGWVAWNEGEVEKLLKEGRTVFVDFTADWCWTCKVNEKVALENEAVKKKFVDLGVVKMKADWTRSDPKITAFLKSQGRSGVPFYVLYKPGQAPKPLSEIITPEQVLSALQAP